MIYLELFYEFFLIGLFTFGGGYAMIPLVRETVVNNGWLTLEEFYSYLEYLNSIGISLELIEKFEKIVL